MVSEEGGKDVGGREVPTTSGRWLLLDGSLLTRLSAGGLGGLEAAEEELLRGFGKERHLDVLCDCLFVF